MLHGSAATILRGACEPQDVKQALMDLGFGDYLDKVREYMGETALRILVVSLYVGALVVILRIVVTSYSAILSSVPESYQSVVVLVVYTMLLILILMIADRIAKRLVAKRMALLDDKIEEVSDQMRQAESAWNEVGALLDETASFAKETLAQQEEVQSWRETLRKEIKVAQSAIAEAERIKSQRKG
ncbi:MAG: hypothetical protein OXH76_01260 [Boseongicola sp.]|nr:hypothetical protein [Boseongicola sp.]